MPSRIIRDGWLESSALNELDAQAERFFLRLCLRADDYGCYSANPLLLKSNLFPLREDVRRTDIPRWLAACESAGLIRCYEVEAKRFLHIVKFGQRIKPNTKPKFPLPPGFSGKSPEPAETRGTVPPYSESESESESEPHSETESQSNREPSLASASKAMAEAKVISQPVVETPASEAVCPIEHGGAPNGAVCKPRFNDGKCDAILPESLRTDAFLSKWAEYIAHRHKARMGSLRQHSIQKQWETMAEWGEDAAIRSIEETIRNGWKGLFPPPSKTTPTKPSKYRGAF